MNSIQNVPINSALYWFEIPSKYQYASMNNGKLHVLYVTENESEIYYPSYSDSKWIQIKNNDLYPILNKNILKIPLSLKYFYILNENLYGRNENDEIYHANYYNNSWTKIDNCEIDNCKINNINDSNYYTSRSWNNIPGKLKQVSIKDNIVCGINTMNNVYCANIGVNPNWIQLPGTFIYVSIYNKIIYAIDVNWNIYQCNNYLEPLWVKEPLKLKYDIDILLP